MFRDIVPKSSLWRKGAWEGWFLPAIIVLVGVAAFGLGRLSAVLEAESGMRVYAPDPDLTSRPLAQPAPNPATAAPAVVRTSGAFVASKSGTKYYPVGCASAARIKATNQVWFASAAEAESAGYTAASACATSSK